MPAKVFAYNTTVQSSTGYAPFELIHTFFPRLPIDTELVDPPEAMKRKDWAEQMHEKAKVMREDALRNQQEAAKLQKKYYDSGARPEEL